MKRKLFTLLLLAALGANVINAAETIDGISYNLDESTRTASVTSGSYSGAIVIPEKITHNNREYDVIAIEKTAFNENDAITSVVIPSSVTTIAESAFYGCAGILSIEIPGSVSRIEALTFANCTSLSNITLNEGLTYIGDFAFGALQQLTSITIPSTVVNMGQASFYNCRRLTKIVWNAKHCADFLYTKNAPFSSYSYLYNSYGYYDIYDDMSFYNSNSNKGLGKGNEWTTSITFGDEVEHIPANLCYGFTGELRNLVIPDNVKTIGDYAFQGCSNIVSVKFGTGLTSIGQGAFSRCCKLVSLKFGVGLTEIGKNAFENCTTLAELSIPDNVTTINPYAFSGCSSLKTITFGTNVTNIGSGAFSGCPINSITSYVVEPPYLESSVFSVSDLMAIDLNVRERSLEDYEKANIWKDMHIGLVANDTRVFTITVSSADKAQGSTSSSGEYDEGEEVVISAMPKDGYHFARWNDGNTDNPRLVEVIGNLTFTAYFAEGSAGTPTPSGNAYQVNISGENCSMNISSQYPEGSVVTMQAMPDECLEFKQWSDGNKDNPRTITVTADGNYKAEFNKITYTISGKAEDANSGSVNVRAK